MRKFINKYTGGDMWVADNRVEEYRAAGHRLAADLESEKPIMNEPVEEDEPVKKPVTRRKKR